MPHCVFRLSPEILATIAYGYVELYKDNSCLPMFKGKPCYIYEMITSNFLPKWQEQTRENVKHLDNSDIDRLAKEIDQVAKDCFSHFTFSNLVRSVGLDSDNLQTVQYFQSLLELELKEEQALEKEREKAEQETIEEEKRTWLRSFSEFYKSDRLAFIKNDPKATLGDWIPIYMRCLGDENHPYHDYVVSCLNPLREKIKPGSHEYAVCYLAGKGGLAQSIVDHCLDENRSN